MEEEEEKKMCNECGEEKPISEFRVHNSYYVHFSCKSCYNNYMEINKSQKHLDIRMIEEYQPEHFRDSTKEKVYKHIYKNIEEDFEPIIEMIGRRKEIEKDFIDKIKNNIDTSFSDISESYQLTYDILREMNKIKDKNLWKI